MLNKTTSSESPDINKMCDDLSNTMYTDNAKCVVWGFVFGVVCTLTAMWVIG